NPLQRCELQANSCLREVLRAGCQPLETVLWSPQMHSQDSRIFRSYSNMPPPPLRTTPVGGTGPEIRARSGVPFQCDYPLFPRALSRMRCLSSVGNCVESH